MLFAQWILGDEDREGFYPLTRCGQCENEAKVQQLFGDICGADFRKRSVTNWDPNYFVIFLTATDKLVCVLECNEDCFMFVEGRKTFWGCAMGHIIPHSGRDKWHWGTLPDFDRRVMRTLENRGTQQTTH